MPLFLATLFVGEAGAGCLLPPAFDPGVGELYFCSAKEGERHLIDYARRSFVKEGLAEDIWINFRGVFDNKLWINVGAGETNDTSMPAWEVIEQLVERMQAIKRGDRPALEAFLAPLEAVQALRQEDQALKQRLLESLRRDSAKPAEAPLRAVLYHVHLKPTREIEERSLMPINHVLSVPSHTDLLHAPRLPALLPGSESKIAVAAGIWTYDWDANLGRSFVAERYDGPENVPFPGEFGYTYTRLAIPEYHRQGLNDPANLSPGKVAGLIAALKPSGAILRFDFAPDWESFKNRLAEAGPGK